MLGIQRHCRAVFCRSAESPEVTDALFRFRKRLFIDLLHWDLPDNGPYELDQFDTDAAFYCGLYCAGEVVGGFRAICTLEPYLAREVFPTLAVTRPFPQGRDVWEISRFGVLPRSDRIQLARVNYALMFRFAALRGASALVAIADRTHERILRLMGIRTARYGPPRSLACDAEGKPIELVAGEIRLSDQSGPKFRNLLNSLRHVEIVDETLVLGRSGLSA
jgi:N-acyl-L-homoserine lactone synthetase